MFDQAVKYAWYYLNAKTKHGVHSPFVYDFVTKVLEDKEVYPVYEEVEKLRQSLLNNKLVTEVEDFGAGGEKGARYEKKVSEIAAKAAKPPKWGKLLFRICQYFQPKNMLELGTSLGITTAYQAKGVGIGQNSESRFVSLEGSENLVELSGINFKNLGIEAIEQVQGNFDETLAGVLDTFPTLDYVFIDGNHRKEPTLRYFEQLLPKCHNETILIFDDIYWSKEMNEAWDEIKAHPQVKVSVDLFYLGIVFLRQEQVEEHFVIRF